MAPFRRKDLLLDREEAIQRGDEAAIAKIDAELNSLKTPKLAFGTALFEDSPKKETGPTREERAAQLNASGQRSNEADIRNSQLAKSIAAKSRRQAELQAKKRAAAKAAEKNDAGNSTQSTEVTAAAKFDEPKQAPPPRQAVPAKPMTQQEKYMEIFRFRERQEERLAELLDFGIEIPTDI